MKRISYLLFLLPLILFAGCAQKNTDGNEQVHNSPDEGLGVEACDNYVDYMSCIADSLGDAGKATNIALDKTVKAREKMPREQLEQICRAAINGVSQVLDMYKEYDCVLAGAALPTNPEPRVDVIEEATIDEEGASADAKLEVVELENVEGEDEKVEETADEVAERTE